MAKFFGRIGFGDTEETARGVYSDTIVERSFYGDVTRAQRNLIEGDNLNRDLTLQNSISVVMDAFLEQNIFAIRYVDWAGTLWTVNSVEVERPRLILRLGEVYNGPTA